MSTLTITQASCADDYDPNSMPVAKTGDQAHPVFSLMRRDVHQSLVEFLGSGQRKIDKWYAGLRVIEVPFDDEADAFLNINTREELSNLER